MLYADRAGRRWEVIDFRFEGRKKKRVSLGSWKAEGRAFVPVGFDSPVMIHTFGWMPYRWTDDKYLRGQIELSKPVTANGRERIEPPPHG